jgi:hypothetical protein
MLGVAGFLWSRRQHLPHREAPATNPEGRSSVILGAAITAVELPTAFPYFAAIVGSGIGTTRQTRSGRLCVQAADDVEHLL